jgi:hypothetical protein
MQAMQTIHKNNTTLSNTSNKVSNLAVLADELGAVTRVDLHLGEVANIGFDDHFCLRMNIQH